MKTIELSRIIIPEGRQRRYFDPERLHAFGDSLQQHGLMHPVVLRATPEGFVLVAGERRIRAVADLAELEQTITHEGEPVPLGHIPYTLLSDLSLLAAEELELEENIQREDLTWQERAAAVARLAALRERQAVANGTEPPSFRDLVEETKGATHGGAYSQTKKELILSRHLDKPEVRAAKTADEAFKILKRAEATERSRALGESVGRTFTADIHRVVNADSLTWLKECPDAQYDVVLTDPPYGVEADQFGDAGGRAAGEHDYDDSTDNFINIVSVCKTELIRITKPQAHLYWFCDLRWFFHLRELFTEAGWWVFTKPLIWHNPQGSRAPWPEHGPQRKYETLLYAVKGKRPVLRMAPDVVTYSPDSNLGHNAQKPVALFEDLLRRSVHPGDRVLDPFCGSGPVFPAAHALKCAATGVEKNTGHYGIAVRRVEMLRAQGELII